MSNDPFFDGETYNHQRDNKRLTGQLWKVYEYVRDGQWHTLSEIAEAIQEPEPSISTRLRDLRKERFGSHRIDRRHKGNGLYEYRLAAGPGLDGDGLPQKSTISEALESIVVDAEDIVSHYMRNKIAQVLGEASDAVAGGQESIKIHAISANDAPTAAPAPISRELRTFYNIQEKYGHGHHVTRLDQQKRCKDPSACDMCRREKDHIEYLKSKDKKND